jgi:hypothetical protein
MARAKTVYRDHQEVCHVWAHGVDRSIRAGNVSTSGDGRTIYSYGLHFPMARRVSASLYLVNPDRYSVSTGKHQGYVRRAIPNSADAWTLPVSLWEAVEKKRGRDLAAYFRKEIAGAWKRANAPRIPATSRVRHGEIAVSRVNSWEALHRILGLRCNRDLVRLPADFGTKMAQWRDRAKELDEGRDARTAAARAKREAAQAARREKLAPVLEELRAEWMKGGPAGKSIDGLGFVSISELETDLLRVQPDDPDTVETSRSARVPLVAARTLWERLPDLPVGKLLPIDVGHYNGVRITESGSVAVGCHEFSRAAVDALATACGWTREEAAQPA